MSARNVPFQVGYVAASRFWLLVPALGVMLGGLGLPVWADDGESGAAPQALASATVDIFVAKCIQCHDPDSSSSRARKHWRDSRDLTALADGYVQPKTRNPEEYTESRLWKILTDEPDYRMPPPKAKAGQLTDDELATVGWWIAAGAMPVEEKESGGIQDQTYVSPPDSGDGHESGFIGRLGHWLGKFHPAAVHVPIGLLLAAAVAELGWWLTKRDVFDFTCRFCTTLGAIGACLAVVTGWLYAAHESEVSSTVSIHRWLGVAVAVLAIVSVGLGKLSAGQPASSARRTMRWAVLANAMMVIVTGHFGGQLVHGHDYYAW